MTIFNSVICSASQAGWLNRRESTDFGPDEAARKQINKYENFGQKNQQKVLTTVVLNLKLLYKLSQGCHTNV